MMLAAHSPGVGCYWIGLAGRPGKDAGFLREIGIPESYRLVASLIFGYLAKVEIMATPRKTDVIIKW